MTDMPFYKDRPKVVKISLSNLELLVEYTKIFIKCSDIKFIVQLIKSLSRNQLQTLRKIAPRRGNRNFVWEHVIPVKVIVDEIIKMVINKDISDLPKLLELYTLAGQIGVTKEQNNLLNLKYNSSMPENWDWKDKYVDPFIRYKVVGIKQLEERSDINIATNKKIIARSEFHNKTFKVKLGIAYYNHGYFNARVENTNLFGKHLSVLKIQLGENSDNLHFGKVNRTAANNYSPRIMAGPGYTKWIKENFTQGECFNVTMISQDYIKLSK